MDPLDPTETAWSSTTPEPAAPGSGTFTNVFDFGIKGYRPKWQRGATLVAGTHARRLAQLPGLRLTGSRIAWNREEDEWWPDWPVILEFQDRRIEINHAKFDELSVTWNSVDTTQPVVMDDLRLDWHTGAPTELVALHGQTLAGVRILEWSGDRNDIANGMVALCFTFPAGQVTVHNALDENGLNFQIPDRRYRVV